ncbi:TetR family transcriptional regulator C-terminal domain-containing protein [Methylopila henanensis]|uniref:TetR family transcriptional regulator C-terminal domain-containing protein n=1 Tax=Methylopila henanensis TaxID=873516 RepID=A0ABW4KAJ7_9HYPH
MDQARPGRDHGEEPAEAGGRERATNAEAKILDAAEQVFAQYGFRGATTAMIAERAGVTKSNIYYYHRSKEALYRALLNGILKVWADTLRLIDEDKSPEDCIRLYLRRKMEFSRARPQLSRIFANEIISGAPHIGDQIAAATRPLLEEKAALIARWIEEGRISPAVNPTFLIFMLWASTQAYADFAAQMQILLGKAKLEPADYDSALDTITAVALGGALARD